MSNMNEGGVWEAREGDMLKKNITKRRMKSRGGMLNYGV